MRNCNGGSLSSPSFHLHSAFRIPHSAFRIPHSRVRIVAMGYQTLLFDIKDGATFITINRPDKLNALNDQVVDELADAAERVATEHAIKGAILSGAGPKAFVAGAGIRGPAERGPVGAEAPA